MGNPPLLNGQNMFISYFLSDDMKYFINCSNVLGVAMRRDDILKEIIKNIENEIFPFGATLIKFVYDYKWFGNVIIEIRDKENICHTYTIDRGDIFVGPICKLGHDEYDDSTINNRINILIKFIKEDLDK